jgi:hypothetical protein
MTIAAAITKIQIAKTWPNILIPLLALADENNTKYPRITQPVAGMRLIKKHIVATSFGQSAALELR